MKEVCEYKMRTGKTELKSFKCAYKVNLKSIL